MLGDPDLLYRAFLNLLFNALQAMPKGGTLKVSSDMIHEPGAGSIQVSIQDTGMGIPHDIHKKIFNPFFTTREKGTGLGLAIVKSIIDGHQGEIEVESEEGKGTTITVRFPTTLKDDQ